MKLSDFIFDFLYSEYGVKCVFMVSGGGAMHLNDSLGYNGKIKVICNHHEQASSIAAEGYSRVTNELSVVCVTTGPGGTNTITGIIGEYLDSIPVLYISGQVKFSTTIESCRELKLRQLGDQEINIVDIVKPVTKYAVMIKDPKKIKYEIQKAIYIAKSARCGPVWIDIPLNVQSSDINPGELESFIYPNYKKKDFLYDNVSKVIDILKCSKSPVIVAGHGIRLSNSINDFFSFLEKCNIPVVSTFNGFDIITTDNKNYMGRIGTIGNRCGNIVLQNADVVLCIGTRNNIRQISYNYENFAKRAENIIVVDIDEAELNKPTMKTSLKIHSDVKVFLELLNKEILNYKLPDFSKWIDWCTLRKERYSTLLREYDSKYFINPYYFVYTLTKLLPNNSIISCANATPSLALFQIGIVKKYSRMFANSGCAAMGYGLPAAIGAACACNGDRPVICFEGDGSIMMNIQELQTVKHYNLPIKIFLFSNREYSSIRQTQDNFFKRRTGCDNLSGVSFPSWEYISKAFGIDYIVIDNNNDIENKIMDVLNNYMSVICNVILEKDYLFLPKISSKQLPDGTMVSRSLEDMTPLLSNDELEDNIYK